MKAERSDLLLIRALYLVALVIVVLNILQAKTMISVLFIVSFILSFALFFLIWKKSMSRWDILCIAVLVATFINVFLAGLLKNEAMDFEYFKKYLIFATSVLFLSLSARIQLDETTVNLMSKSTLIISIVIIVLYFLMGSQLYVYTNTGIKYLYFNFDNPNFASMCFLVIALMNLVEIAKKKSVAMRVLHLMIVIFMGFFIVETKSRNTLLIIAVFLLVWLVVFLRKKSGFMCSKAFSWLVAMWPILFSIAYLILINAPTVIQIFSFLSDEGKHLDSRDIVWTTIYSRIFDAPLLGSYTVALERQAHNTHLDVWSSYGIVPLLFIIVALKRIVYKNGYVYRDKVSFLYMIGFCCCIFMGMAEAALFSGGQTLYIIVGGFILLSNNFTEVGATLVPSKRV